MALLIKDGEIITASERYVADIYCAGEQITPSGASARRPAGTPVVEAKGK
jgi:dihydropyrimidinase